MLEGLHRGLTGLRLESTVLRLIHDLANLPLVMQDLVVDLFHDIWLRNNIGYTDGETCVHEPVVDYELDVGEDVSASLGSQVLPDDVDETTGGCTHDTLRDYTSYDLSLLDDHSFVLGVRVGFTLFEVNRFRDDE